MEMLLYASYSTKRVVCYHVEFDRLVGNEIRHSLYFESVYKVEYPGRGQSPEQALGTTKFKFVIWTPYLLGWVLYAGQGNARHAGGRPPCRLGTVRC